MAHGAGVVANPGLDVLRGACSTAFPSCAAPVLGLGSRPVVLQRRKSREECMGPLADKPPVSTSKHTLPRSTFFEGVSQANCIVHLVG